MSTYRIIISDLQRLKLIKALKALPSDGPDTFEIDIDDNRDTLIEMFEDAVEGDCVNGFTL